MPADKGTKVSEGIWRHRYNKGQFIAVIGVRDRETEVYRSVRKSFHRLDLARKWRDKTKTSAVLGELDLGPSKKITFRDFTTEYFAAWKLDHKPGSVQSAKSVIDGLNRIFGDRYLHTFKKRDIEQYLNCRLSGEIIFKREGIARATRNRELSRLRCIFGKAVDWDHIRKNPCEGITQEREPLKVVDFLSVEEVHRLLNVCDRRIHALILVAVNTGMRRGELNSLRWRDVDFERGQLSLHDTKNGDTRYVPMNDAVQNCLRFHQKQQSKQAGGVVEHVFARPDTGKPFVDIRKMFYGALKKAGVERRFTFHGLRHTAVSGVNYSFASATIRIPGGLCGKGSGVALLGVGFGVVAGRRGLAGFCPPEGGQTSRADGPCVLSI